ncbi:hypothetical protein BT96DRAFT_945218 [Gymnopus androsaceus JB14]|uniref:Uncharacterized protein n=1 Tax=Gymnopus androsaceus JB14 TaxID=1447944 RepID=A0A6A4H1K5_9AGAR|nr:hypothetical protein BT96DRAFT_945218 [Gymnopus androsaceus JB14]
MDTWVLLDNYFASDTSDGDWVHTALEKLGVGVEWEDMWGCITGMELGDEDAAKELKAALDAMKLSVGPHTSVSNEASQFEDAVEDVQKQLDSLKPSSSVDKNAEATSNVGHNLFNGLEEFEAQELTEKQNNLAEHLNHFTDSVMLEEYGIYYLRCQKGKESEIIQQIECDIKWNKQPKYLCQAFASKKQGGIYIWVHSMLNANYILAAYFRYIDGLIYSHCPVFLYVVDNTQSSIMQKDNPGFNVPLLWKGPYLAMPIHHWVTVWVIAKKGLYRGDTGVIIQDSSGNLDESECVIVFLPRLDLSLQKFKRVKKAHPSSPNISATSPLHFHLEKFPNAQEHTVCTEAPQAPSKCLKKPPNPRDIEGHLRDTGGHLRDTGGYLRDTGGHLRDTGGHLRDTGGHLRDTEEH